MASRQITSILCLVVVGLGFLCWVSSRAGAQVAGGGGESHRFAIIVHEQGGGEDYLLDTATGEVWHTSGGSWFAMEKLDVRQEGRQEQIDRARNRR